MQIEILEKYKSDTIENFTLRVNKTIDKLNKHYHVCHVKIEAYQYGLICFLIYKNQI